MRTAAVVLAAGKSERMGANKLLLEVAGRTVLDQLLDALDESVVEEVFVVLGHRPEELRPIVGTHRAEAVLNPDYEKGMTSSFKAGLRKVTADAVFLVLGDQIGLEAELLGSMAARIESEQDALIVSAVHEGRRGHPVLLREALYREIMNLGELETLRDVVQRHEENHLHVEGGAWCTMDMDTQEEFEEARRLFEASLGAGPR